MKRTELRIGNYLKLGTIKLRVSEINQESFYAENEDEEFFKNTAWEIEPIELSEEWLLKFGFNYQDAKYWTDGLCIHTSDKDFYIIQEQGRVFIKSVHQLQNLYFALRGQELTVK